MPIVLIKLVHSAIFLANSAAITYIFLSGVTGRPSRWLGPAFFLAVSEVAIFLLNRGRCPLTIVVERLSAESGRVSDIFLPLWFADRIPYLCAPPLLVGAIAWTARICGGSKVAGGRPIIVPTLVSAAFRASSSARRDTGTAC